MEYTSDIEKHWAELSERTKLVKKIKKKRPKQLDSVFHESHDETFKRIDCLKCANCCKTTSPIFRDVDILRISKKLKLNAATFEKEYLKVDEDGDWVLKSSPCTFLMPDNRCFIYDVRPQACREYPHTDRKRMIQIMDLTLKNAEVCPAVSRILGSLTEKLG